MALIRQPLPGLEGKGAQRRTISARLSSSAKTEAHSRTTVGTQIHFDSALPPLRGSSGGTTALKLVEVIGDHRASSCLALAGARSAGRGREGAWFTNDKACPTEDCRRALKGPMCAIFAVAVRGNGIRARA